MMKSYIHKVFNLRGRAWVSCLLCLWLSAMPAMADVLSNAAPTFGDSTAAAPDTLYADQLSAATVYDGYTLGTAGAMGQPLHRAPRIAKAAPVPASQCLLDSIIGYDNDGTPIARTYYKYDSRRYQTAEETYTLINGTWVGKSRSENEYDDAGRTLLTATYTWRNGAWAGTAKTVNTYDAAGRNTDTQAFLWSATANDWTNNYRYAYTYDATGDLTATLFYSGSGTDWLLSSRYLYAYDNARRKTLEAYYSSYNSATATWVGDNKTETAYDNHGNVTLKTDYTWRNGDWQGKSQVATTYNAAGKTTSTLRLTWRNGAWTNLSRMDYEYDANGKTLFTSSYTWSNDAWHGSSRTENITGGTIQYAWVDTTSTWVYSKKTEATRDTDGGSVFSTYVYADTAWVLARRTKSLTVTTDGLKTLEANYIWSDTAYVPTGTRTEYTYNASRLLTLQARYQWGTDSTWTPVYRVTYTYNARGKCTSEQRLDYANGTWIGLYWYEHGYDEQGRTTLSTSYRWQRSAWAGLSKSEIIYNAAGQKAEDISYKWVNGAWTYMFRHVYTYDAKGRKTLDVLYRGNGDAWNPDTRYEYEYLFDASNRQYETRESEWYNEAWTLRNLSSATYDARNRQTAALTARYSGGVLQSYQNDVYTYDCGTRYGVAPTTTICEGDSALFCGQYYRFDGIYMVTIPATEAFYDSAVTWTLIVQSPVTAPAEQLTLCADQLPYRWHTLTCATAGTYHDTAYYAAGCDSIYYTLHLTVNQPTASDTVVTVCASELPYTWYDQTLTAAGTATRTVPNAAGCDSIITLHLTVNQPTGSTVEETIHASELPYIWHGQSLTDEGTYIFTTTNAAGCDSVITLTLHVEREVRMWLTLLEEELADSTYTLHDPDTVHLMVVFDPASVRPQVLSYSVTEGHHLVTLHNTLGATGGVMLTTNANQRGGTAVIRGTAQVAGAWHTARLTLHIIARTTTDAEDVADTAAPARRLVMHHGTVYIECRTDHGVEYYTLQGQKVETIGNEE